MKFIRYQNGIKEYQAEDWNDIILFLSEKVDFDHYIWRGHSQEDWLLEPSLDRLLRKMGKLSDKKIRQNHLSSFKMASRGRKKIAQSKGLSENEWWAIGQHNGLATPLLDWTTSPFIGLFFAYYKNSDLDGNCVLFGLSKTALNTKSRKLIRTKSAPEILSAIKIVEPMVDDNQRLVNQSGLFTRAPDGVDIESWITKYFEDEKKKVRMWKLFLPKLETGTALKTLNRMNINYLTLFPDLYGASKFVNMKLQIQNY